MARSLGLNEAFLLGLRSFGHGLIFGAMKTRPLSPHLQIYRPQISSVISILHRAAGLALVPGLVILALWLCAAVSGPDAYASFMECATSQLGQGVFIALTAAYTFYFLCEVRYLAWAFGYGFSLPVMNITGWLTVIGAAALTALIWI